MTKKEIRKQYLATRIQLAPDQCRKSTEAVLRHFRQLSFPELRYFLSYYPLTDRNEFDVEHCEKYLTQIYPEAKCCWPIMKANGNEMEARTVDKDRMLVKNQYNILEPLHGDPVDAANIDLVFVPLLAFDQQGYRVGYGKGFYDRFLKTCRKDILTIGFSFFDPVEQIDDLNEFDVPLMLCITPTRVYEF